MSYNKRICIDPGHGGKDNGAAWGYAEEDDINLTIAYFLDYELRLGSFHRYITLLTREKDETMSLQERCKIANNFNAHLFISIHCDAYHNQAINGMSVHIYKDTAISGGIGKTLSKQLAEDFPEHRNRGVKESNFHVLKYTDMRAVLVECEFLSNPEMREWLHEPENQKSLAISLKNGINNFYYGDVS